MQEISLSQLVYCDFDLKNITAAKTYFADKNVVNYVGNGRRKNLLHLVTEGERIYKIDGKTIFVPCGNIILIPDNTEYQTVSLAKNAQKVSGIGICFDMVDQQGNKIQLKKDVYTEFCIDTLHPLERFNMLSQLYHSPLTPVFTLKSALSKLLHDLCSSVFTEQKELSAIKPALDFIAEHYTKNLPIKTYSDKCNMSESNFRKKFCKCTGMSPIEYRNELRFEKARQLYVSNMGMQQIAEEVGFFDAHYLAKLYKKAKGTTIKKDTEII